MSATSTNQKHAHIALLPSAGMDHLTIFLRLASLLISHNLKITIINQIQLLKNWVNQEEILRHESIGCFMNSITEAIWNGVRVVAWPQHGDQKMNALIRLGIWPKNWGSGGVKVVMGKKLHKMLNK
ncbi:UDP-glycosyltransferase 13 [Euphorbia peplus]|nr:UDP-glycosyltransferase 13 [Euphorbia peplus]